MDELNRLKVVIISVVAQKIEKLRKVSPLQQKSFNSP